MRRLALTIFGLTLYLAPAIRDGADSGAIVRWARDLARPVVLPMLWQGYTDTRQRAEPVELARRGELLMRFLPEWSDGHIVVASHLAFEASLAAREPGAALDHVVAALDILERALPHAVTAAAREDLLRAMAGFVWIRCGADEALAAAWEARFAAVPSSAAEDFLRRIPRLAHSSHLATELFFTLRDGIAEEIRWGTKARVLPRIDTALALLPRLDDQELVREGSLAMHSFRSYWTGSDDISLGELAGHPLLEKIVAALQRANPPK